MSRGAREPALNHQNKNRSQEVGQVFDPIIRCGPSQVKDLTYLEPLVVG